MLPVVLLRNSVFLFSWKFNSDRGRAWQRTHYTLRDLPQGLGSYRSPTDAHVTTLCPSMGVDLLLHSVVKALAGRLARGAPQIGRHAVKWLPYYVAKFALARGIRRYGVFRLYTRSLRTRSHHPHLYPSSLIRSAFASSRSALTRSQVPSCTGDFGKCDVNS